MAEKPRELLATCVYGLGAGVAASVFQLAVHFIFRQTFEEAAKLDFGKFAFWSLLTVLGASLISGWLLNRFCKEAAGSGIPQLKLAFWKDFGYVLWRTVWVKFVAGAVSVGGGVQPRPRGAFGPDRGGIGLAIRRVSGGSETEPPAGGGGWSGGRIGSSVQHAVGGHHICAGGDHC